MQVSLPATDSTLFWLFTGAGSHLQGVTSLVPPHGERDGDGFRQGDRSVGRSVRPAIQFQKPALLPETEVVPSHNPTKAAAALPRHKLGTIAIDGRPVDGDRLVPLLDWTLKQHVNDNDNDRGDLGDLGDLGHYPSAVSEAK